MTCDKIKIEDIPTFDNTPEFELSFYKQKTVYNMLRVRNRLPRNDKKLLSVNMVGNEALKYGDRTISLRRHCLADGSYVYYYVYADTDEIVKDIIACVPTDSWGSSISLYIPKYNRLTASNRREVTIA